MIRSKIEVKGQGRATFARFDGLAEVAGLIERVPPVSDPKSCGWQTPTDWNGYANRERALDWLRGGDLSRVERSDAVLSMLEAINPPAHAFETQRAVVGGVPSVPDFLSGNPMNMRLRRRVQTQKAPINIVVDVCYSSVVDPATIERRGAAALALVRSLSAVRPVTLMVVTGWQMNGGETILTAYDLDTAPLDLARAAYALTSPGFARYASFHCAEAMTGKTGNSFPFAFGDHQWAWANLAKAMAEHLSGGEAFVAMPTSGMDDFKSDDDAARWVARTVQTLTDD